MIYIVYIYDIYCIYEYDVSHFLFQDQALSEKQFDISACCIEETDFKKAEQNNKWRFNKKD